MSVISFPGRTRRIIEVFCDFMDALAPEDIKPNGYSSSAVDFIAGVKGFVKACRSMLPEIAEEELSVEVICGIVAEGYARSSPRVGIAWQLSIEKCNPNVMTEPLILCLQHACSEYSVKFILTSRGPVSTSRINFESSGNSAVASRVSKKLSKCFSSRPL